MTNRNSLSIAVVFSLLLALDAQGKSPNVVLIMVDDLGYHDMSCYGHPKIKTPVLDGWAKDGIRLTSFYAGATICTPSRMALLTGAYPSRLGWTRGVVGYIMRKGTGLSPQALTMAEIFKAQGYRTGMVGKWHLGDEPQFRPHQQGFDQAYYINKSNNQTNELWQQDSILEKPFNNRLLTQKFTEQAVRFIREHKSKPFLLYVPYTAPHFPVEAHPQWKGKSKFGVFGDVVEELDARIGEILTTLKTEGIDKDTIVVFLSDNGPEPLTKASKAIPFRGKKWDALEGGTRVPCIVRWPGVIPAGRTNDAMIAAIDLLPTLCQACGIDLTSASKGSPKIDGVSVLETLQGRSGVAHPRTDLLFWHGADGYQAIRVGQWKLFVNRRAARLPGKGKGPVLFDLASEIDEKTDVSAEHPERVKEMQALAAKRLADIKANRIALGE